MKLLKKSVKITILLSILLYQKTISPDHGFFRFFFPHGCCKYYPTCSQYTFEAIKKDGIRKGVSMGAWRLLRCNPFSKGGIDKIN